MKGVGIKYYSMDTNHLRDTAIKLLFNEFDADGYWIWKCLLSAAYEEYGYYVPVSDKDWLTLFASDVCKKRVSLVEEVIGGCVRRGLFEKAVYDAFGILTSKRMQENYLDATERRKDERILFEELLLVEVDVYKNVRIVSITSGNVNISLKKEDTSEQIKLKEIKGKETKGNESSGAGAPEPEKKSYKKLTEQEFYNELLAYVGTYDKAMLRAFYDYWRETSAGGKMKFQLERTWQTNLRLVKWYENQLKFDQRGKTSRNIGKAVPGKPEAGGVAAGGFGKL